MCTSPILIRNRKYRSIHVDLKSSYIKVPCGSCDECLRQRSNDLYVRARYEYYYCLRKGGSCFMCCLTYDNNNVPILEVNGKKYMVFNKEDVQKFIKRLRIRLDRFYWKYYNRPAPSFKYLVTCEFGSDPTKSHRPHYHILIFFTEFVGFRSFRSLFDASRFIDYGKCKKEVFGRIFQCEPLDPKRGGVRYSAKYILKDSKYQYQSDYIKGMIKFYKEYVNNLFCIDSLEKSNDALFKYKCIRSSKEYKLAYRKYVYPWSGMLQFYLLSNDLGISAILDKYGENIVNMPCVNFENFPYRIPKLVKQRYEQLNGSAKADEFVRTSSFNFLKMMFETLVHENKISRLDSVELLDFFDRFIYVRSGNFYLLNPEGFNIRRHLDNGSSLAGSSNLLPDIEFFYDNGFYELREKLYRYMSLYDSEERRMFRASVVRMKNEREKNNYETRKINKYGKNVF